MSVKAVQMSEIGSHTLFFGFLMHADQQSYVSLFETSSAQKMPRLYYEDIEEVNHLGLPLITDRYENYMKREERGMERKGGKGKDGGRKEKRRGGEERERAGEKGSGYCYSQASLTTAMATYQMTNQMSQRTPSEVVGRTLNRQ